MSTRSTSSKPKKTAKTTSKTAKKSTAKTATAPKSRLAGPKPPKAQGAPKTVSRSVTASSVAAARDAKTSTSKVPAPDMSPKTNVMASVTAPTELKKKELVDLVVARSDVKKKYAKPVVEALLEVLGETLGKGREMNLQPLGKVKYNRTKETDSARIVVTKIRQSKQSNARAVPPQRVVADAAE